MIRLLLAAFCLLLAVPAAAQDRIIPIGDFDRIVVEGPFEVRLVRDRITRATVSGDRVAVGGVSVEVQGHTLRVRRNPNNWSSQSVRPAGPARILLTGRELRSARVFGGGSLTIDGVRGQRLELALEGGGSLRAADVRVDQLSAGLRGSGQLSLAGTTGTLNADVQGAGAFDAAGLDAVSATLLAAMSGTVAVRAQRTATITSNGLGVVTVHGPAACTLRGVTAANVTCESGR